MKERGFLNRGFLNGPLFPIYGIGVTLVVLALEPYRDDLGVLYLASAVLVTVLEYITEVLLDSKMPCNIKGYVCILFL